MKLTTLHEAASLDTVVERMFSGISAKDRSKLAAAIIKANPTLEGRDRLDAGTVLVVPAIVGVKAEPSLRPSESEDPIGQTGAWVLDAVNDYATYLTQRHTEFQEQLKQEAALLKDREFTAALAQRRDAAELVPAITAAIKARGKDAATAHKDFQAAVKNVAKTLEGL
jgi:hypothetical protein